MTTTDIERGERLHGLDALRGAALLLGVVLHGALSFFPTQIWIVGDDQRSVWAGGLFFVIHLFRMTTFFVSAGLFAHLMLSRLGVAGFEHVHPEPCRADQQCRQHRGGGHRRHHGHLGPQQSASPTAARVARHHCPWPIR